MADPNSLGHFFENFTVSMVSVVIALIGFWTTFVKNLVSRKDVQDMIQNQSQYMKDREEFKEVAPSIENGLAFRR